MRSVSVLLLVGAPGTGKTTLSAEMGRMLPDWRRACIDEFKVDGGGWPAMTKVVQGLETHAILESVALPRPYRQALRIHRVACVTTHCTEATRLARLAERGDDALPRRNYPPMRGVRHFRFNTEMGVRPDAVDYLLKQLGLRTGVSV